jgi:hypothetical protein
MDPSLVSRAIIGAHLIANKPRAAFARGAGRDDHGFNWQSPHAIAVWQAAWDHCAALKQRADEVSPP